MKNDFHTVFTSLDLTKILHGESVELFVDERFKCCLRRERNWTDLVLDIFSAESDVFPVDSKLISAITSLKLKGTIGAAPQGIEDIDFFSDYMSHESSQYWRVSMDDSLDLINKRGSGIRDALDLCFGFLAASKKQSVELRHQYINKVVLPAWNLEKEKERQRLADKEIAAEKLSVSRKLEPKDVQEIVSKCLVEEDKRGESCLVHIVNITEQAVI
ncbi:hypothetical protein [Vibrio sp. D431a]|uniref:hypothetical protein n=1 Tax=Vibrio sp. D431a TaxID=2837388 RepID=UPI002554F9C1|nr:hypothetical protein [Vibrio sp. D431a]MDK9789849.1 hypothetical protein [Vibrio sp. D431a]